MMRVHATLSSAAGTRPAAGRPQRAGGVTARAASTRMPGGDNKDHHSQPASPSTSTSGRSEDVITLAATLGLTGASIGTYLDGIHSRVGVLVYDKAPIIHGSLHTSAFVPPLLAGKCRGTACAVLVAAVAAGIPPHACRLQLQVPRALWKLMPAPAVPDLLIPPPPASPRLPAAAAFYMVLGGLYVQADSWLLERGDTATQAAYRRCNLGTMCLSFG
jgi:hypothetical protein